MASGKKNIELGTINSWEENLGESKNGTNAKKKTKWSRRTFLLTPELSGRIDELANEYGLELNDLVRYLFTQILDQVDSGKHKLPVRQRTVSEIEWD